MPISIRWRVAILVIAVAIVGAVAAIVLLRTPAVAPAASPRPAEFVSEEPCPDSEFTCITLRVPRDHFATSSDGSTFEVTFALLRASGGPRQGVFVTVTGGPGSSGIAAADGYTEVFDPAITEQYDIVFLDQRGVGMSEPLDCTDATLAWYSTPEMPTASEGEASAYLAAAERYAAACVAETGVEPADLAYYATRQAVEDLEAFRVWLDADQIDLYGESYGTQYAQAYASAHPDRLRSLFLDGPVDLTLSGVDYYAEDVGAFDEALSTTLAACASDTACRADVAGGDPLAAYDELADRLRGSPTTYDFVTADGELQERSFTLGDLETAAAGYVYGPFDRMLLQRAMAHASRGELLPLARLTYLSLVQDPETLEAIPDPTYSDAMYYAVECMDYAYGSGSADERAAAFLAAGEAAGVAEQRLGSVFYGDLPCVHWPVHPAGETRPDYLTDTPYPVFVLASNTDPATPYAGARRIFEELDDGYLVVQPGGPHIIFGRGSPCPDDLVTAFLVSGERPAERETTCEEVEIDPYVLIPAPRVSDYPDALAAMVATDDEIATSADYWAWDAAEPLTVGCLNGGWLRYESTDLGYTVTLEACEMSAGLPLTGEGTIDDVEGTANLTVTAPDGTDLTYERDAEGEASVTGTYRGQAVP